MSRYRYLHEVLSCVTLGLKPDEPLIFWIYKQDVEGEVCLPIKEKGKCCAYARECSLQHATGTVLGKSDNPHSQYKGSQGCRDCTESMLWPGRTQGTVGHPASSEMRKAGGHFKE